MWVCGLWVPWGPWNVHWSESISIYTGPRRLEAFFTGRYLTRHVAPSRPSRVTVRLLIILCPQASNSCEFNLGCLLRSHSRGGLHVSLLLPYSCWGTVFVLSLLHTVVGGLYLYAFLLHAVTLVLRCATGWSDSHWRHCRCTLVLLANCPPGQYSAIRLPFDCWMDIRGRDVHSVPSPVPAAGTMLAYRCLCKRYFWWSPCSHAGALPFPGV